MKALRTMLVGLCALGAVAGAEAGGVDDLEAGTRAHDQGNYDEALRLYTKAIVTGELPPANLPVAFYYRGNSWYAKQDVDRALADYSEAIRLNPLYVDALSWRASIWTEHKKDFDRAIADLSELIRLNPRDASSLAHRGSAWREKKDFERAIADYTEAIRVDPQDTFPRNRRGLVYLLLGNYRAAIADFDSAMKIWPEDSHSLYGRGLARRMMGERAAGEADMAAAAKAYPIVVDSYARDGVPSK